VLGVSAGSGSVGGSGSPALPETYEKAVERAIQENPSPPAANGYPKDALMI
jgi:hypothetical protein